MSAKVTLKSTQLLAVEGKDEYNFFEAFFKHLHLPGVQCIDVGGKDRFRKEFIALAINEGFGKLERIGLVRDAETNLAPSAFTSICRVLQKCNHDILQEDRLPVPDKPGVIKIKGDYAPGDLYYAG